MISAQLKMAANVAKRIVLRDIRGLNSMDWKDKNGKEIYGGMILRNNFNDPPELMVLTDQEGTLFLGDWETPFDKCYGFDEYWEVV